MRAPASHASAYKLDIGRSRWHGALHAPQEIQKRLNYSAHQKTRSITLDSGALECRGLRQVEMTPNCGWRASMHNMRHKVKDRGGFSWGIQLEFAFIKSIYVGSHQTPNDVRNSIRQQGPKDFSNIATTCLVF